jgi:hypothetical protein
LPGLIDRARFLAFYEEANKLVVVGGIKQPNDTYRDRVFREAKSKETTTQFGFELGWIVVKEKSSDRGGRRS